MKQKYKFRIFLDESYSFGVLGENGRGLTEFYNVDVSSVAIVTVVVNIVTLLVTTYHSYTASYHSYTNSYNVDVSSVAIFLVLMPFKIEIVEL